MQLKSSGTGELVDFQYEACLLLFRTSKKLTLTSLKQNNKIRTIVVLEVTLY